MGVVSACLPSLRPLFKQIIHGTYHGPSFRSRSGKEQGFSVAASSKDVISDARHAADELRSLSCKEGQEAAYEDFWGHNVYIHGGRKLNPRAVGDDENQLPKKRIKVRTEVTLISTERLEYRDQLF